MTDTVTVVVNLAVAASLLAIPAAYTLTAWRERAREQRNRRGTDDRLTVLTTSSAAVAVLALARAQADWSQLPVAIWIGAVATLALGAAGRIRRLPDLPWVARRSSWRLAKITITAVISIALLALTVS
ncbi:hypothetical protein [Mycobacterium sp. DL99]|uniref:hypothetical protein n=1 Tax=Mycobacterium sp. DL99 TaxID=2528957 RepID=UPI00108081EE|nr:hypothetical protein [Mycobacterium sp. DL99]